MVKDDGKIKNLVERLELSYNELKKLDDNITSLVNYYGLEAFASKRKTIKSKDVVYILKQLQSLVCILKYLLSDTIQILKEEK